MTLLLTLSTSSLVGLFEEPEKGPDSLLDAPRFAMEHLQLRGLYLEASSLSGWSIKELDRLRDRADKAGCPCLVLADDQRHHHQLADDQTYRYAIVAIHGRR